MENSPNQQHDLEIDPGSRQFKGIRLRKWGRWVSEIRIPKSREKIWLGSYTTPEQAARAYDAAVYCLKGPNAKFNFPESVRDIPSVTSVSRQQIQHAALKYALGQPPPSVQSQSSTVSVMELSGEEQKISEECPDLALWSSLFLASDDNGIPNSEEFPLIDEDFSLTLQEQGEECYISTDLWNFEDQDV